MKGPGMRVDLDVRRVWRCPRCGRQRKALGDVTAIVCRCEPGGVFMQLIEPRRQVKTFPIPADYSTACETAPEIDGIALESPIGESATPANPTDGGFAAPLGP